MPLHQLPLLLWRDGYRALGGVWDRVGGDAARVKVLGTRAWIVRGRPQVERFYDEAFVQRSGSLPPPLANLLFGKGAVHGLDGEDHLHRKGMFLSLLDAEAALTVSERAEETLAKAWAARSAGEPFDPFDVFVEAYGAAVLDWAGIELSQDDAIRRSADLGAIVDGFGGQGLLTTLRAALARRRCNAWASQLVRDARTRGDVESVVGVLAHHRERDGQLLDERTAGVELLNILRPTVAVAFLGAFAALFLERSPTWRARLAGDVSHEAVAFAQEVRRHAPFVPALMGRAARDADWAGCPVREGDRVVLDVYGVDHDPARWPHPTTFDPERFLADEPDEFDLVPQGGGLREFTHRCPGEPLTLSLLTTTVRFLTEQGWTAFDATYDDRRIPARPAIRLVRP